MNGFDYVVIALLVLAAKRGFRNGLASEFYRLFRIAVAMAAGTSLYRMFSDAVSGLLNIESGLSDPVLFGGATVLVWQLLTRVRRWMEALIVAKTPARAQSVGGAVAAFLKTAIFIVAVVTTVSLSSWIPGHVWIAEHSATGRLVTSFLPSSECIP